MYTACCVVQSGSMYIPVTQYNTLGLTSNDLQSNSGALLQDEDFVLEGDTGMIEGHLHVP